MRITFAIRLNYITGGQTEEKPHWSNHATEMFMLDNTELSKEKKKSLQMRGLVKQNVVSELLGQKHTPE